MAKQDYADYGVTHVEDKQKLFRLIKGINHNDGPTFKNSKKFGDENLPDLEHRNLSCGYKQKDWTENKRMNTRVRESPDPLDKVVGDRANIQDGFLLSQGSDNKPGSSMNLGYGDQGTGKELYQPLGESIASRPQSANVVNGGGVARIRVVVRKRPMNKVC